MPPNYYSGPYGNPNTWSDIPGLPLFGDFEYSPDQIAYLRSSMPSFLESPSQGDVYNLLQRWGYPYETPSFGDFGNIAQQMRKTGQGGFPGKKGSFLDSTLGQIAANFATGGLYGTAKGLTSGDPWQAAAAASNPLSPGGAAQINTQLRGPQSTLIATGGALAGAALGGAFASPSQGLYIPEGAVTATDPLTGAPAYMLKTAEGISYVPMEAATPGAFYTGPISGALSGSGYSAAPAGGAGGSSPYAPFLGMQLAGQLAGMMGPSPEGQGDASVPQMGARQATQARPAGGAGGPIGGSSLHPGLAPRFEQRQKGGQESPGLADPAFGYSAQQYQQMMMR